MDHSATPCNTVQECDMVLCITHSAPVPILAVLVQFEAFAKGFMMLCGGPAIHLFSATEIERLVCGNPILDFLALQNNARYDGGFTADHRVRPALMRASLTRLSAGSVQVLLAGGICQCTACRG